MLEATLYVFEIIKPGTYLVGMDKDDAWLIIGQLDLIIMQFHEANIALNCFISASEWRDDGGNRAVVEEDMRRRPAIYEQVLREMEDNPNVSSEDIDFEASARFEKERWQRTGGPNAFKHMLPFIYAKTFLFALDGIDRFLELLSKDIAKGVPKEVADWHGEFVRCFPQLREVRNSAHHSEDRSRGIRRGTKELDLKPIIDGPIHAPHGGALLMNCLNGSRYGATMADGHYGEVDVSVESMRQLQRILQGIFDSFAWTGRKQLRPF